MAKEKPKKRPSSSAPKARKPSDVKAKPAVKVRLSSLPQIKIMQAKYDAAQTTGENARHWANADHLSGKAATAAAVRRTLRSRARYEVANNSYASGICRTMANYVVGRGPRLQMLTNDTEFNRKIETEWAEWSEEVDLPGKLWLMRFGQIESGESFAIRFTNSKLAGKVRLDFRVVESDQVQAPWEKQKIDDPFFVDGITFDRFGNPKSYCVLDRHPGDNAVPDSTNGYKEIDAKDVAHLFRPERPGQARGIPELMPAVPLFAQLRRYTLAVLSSAEQAAMIGGLIYTDAPGSESEDPEPLDTIEMDRNTWLTLPNGWKPSQLKAEQPTTVYPDFKREIVNEIARCLEIPLAIALANSADLNYASGRLDHQMFFKAVGIHQRRLERSVCNWLLRSWIDEASLIEGYIPQAARMIGSPLPHQWFWDGLEHVDPAKEANAQMTRLACNSTTLAKEYARQGLDWEVELEQIAKEINKMRDLGIVPVNSGIYVQEEHGGKEEEDDE